MGGRRSWAPSEQRARAFGGFLNGRYKVPVSSGPTDSRDVGTGSKLKFTLTQFVKHVGALETVAGVFFIIFEEPGGPQLFEKVSLGTSWAPSWAGTRRG